MYATIEVINFVCARTASRKCYSRDGEFVPTTKDIYVAYMYAAKYRMVDMVSVTTTKERFYSNARIELTTFRPKDE